MKPGNDTVVRNDNDIVVRVAQWPEEQVLLRTLRDRVFVQEQRVPVEIEWDNQDNEAVHFIAIDLEQQPVGTARVLASGQLGRMAVLPNWRNRGIGSIILHHVLAWAKPSYSTLFLHAQVRAIPFYTRAGFVAYGNEFVEAGIVHQSMQIDLSQHNA